MKNLVIRKAEEKDFTKIAVIHKINISSSFFSKLGVSFLKDEAYLPFGAFNIAAASQVPVVVLLSAKVGPKKYIVDVSNILYPRYNSQKDKKLQLKEYVQQFADVLEKYVSEYPYQCFLFHDIWSEK